MVSLSYAHIAGGLLGLAVLFLPLRAAAQQPAASTCEQRLEQVELALMQERFAHGKALQEQANVWEQLKREERTRKQAQDEVAKGKQASPPVAKEPVKVEEDK